MASPRSSQSRASAILPARKWARPPEITAIVSSDWASVRLRRSGTSLALQCVEHLEGAFGQLDRVDRIGTPLRQRSQERLGACPFTRRGPGMRRHPAQHVVCSGQAPFDALEHTEKEADVVPVRPGGERDLIDPVDDGGHFAPLEDLGALRRDDVESRLPILGPQEVLDGNANLAPFQVPGGGLGQQEALSRPDPRRAAGSGEDRERGGESGTTPDGCRAGPGTWTPARALRGRAEHLVRRSGD